MPATITEVELDLITRINSVFTDNQGNSKLRAVDGLPGEFDAETIKRMRAHVPAVYVLYLGGKKNRNIPHTFESNWAVYAVTGHAGGHHNRRLGDARDIGTYEILETLVPSLDGVIIDGCGALEIVQIENLYTGNLDSVGISAYAAIFTLPMPTAMVVDPASLDDFKTYHSDYAPSAASLPLPDGGHPVVHETLEQS